MSHLRRIALCAALALGAKSALAITLDVPLSARAEDLRAEEGRGAQVQFVRAIYGGFPLSLDDARALLEGTTFVPALDVFCGVAPYIDFTNGTVVDSLGRQDPTVMCLPFIDPSRAMSAAKCRNLSTFPQGIYYTNGGASLRVAGLLAIREAGTYTLAWGHDDGFGMTVGDLTVFEFTYPTGSRVDYAQLNFPEAGLYRFQLDWFDGGGGALIDWYIARGAHHDQGLREGGFSLVPARDLYPSGALPCTPRCVPCPAAAPFCDYDQSRCFQCRTTDDCAECEACVSGTCRPAREAPLADLPARCRPTPDAAVIEDASRPSDASFADIAPDVRGIASSEGCGCRSSRTPVGIPVKFALVALAWRRRRRAWWRQS